MCNLLWICVCLLLPLTLAHSEVESSKVNVTDPKTAAVPAQLPLQLPLASNQTQLPNAEKLIRYRRHPPHGKRSKRRRVKSPKIKYGPPSHPPAPPVSYYKPSSSYPAHIEEPTFSLDDFQHLKFDGTDFQIPASSYEAQSMDLNLYSQEDNDLYGAHKFPSLEYNFGGHESPPENSFDHTPHTKYGVPPLHQSFEPSSYDTPESFISHHYAAPPAAAHPPSAPPSTHYGVPSAPPSTHYDIPAAPPSTHYGVPSVPAHVPSYSQPGPPPAPDSYSIYEQKIPNTGYHQNFAEPPHRAPPASGHGSNFEISYSPPAYEISTSYQDHEQEYEHNYQPPSSSHDGHFAEPPLSVPPPQHPPQYHPPPSYSAPHPPPYAPPHAPPHPPQQSPPHPPPHPPQHPPPHYPQQEAEPPSSYTNVELHPNAQQYPNENYVLPSEELPLNQNHKFPSFDFPKSSYEVPIYDPIPFEASNKDEQESYPPILPDSSSNDLPSDAHASGSSQSPAKSRKRKRRPSAAVISKKHTLDVPELQEAYDADSHVHVRGTDLDTAAHGSRHVEQKRNYVPSTATTTTTPAPWSPMRLRTTSSAFIPTIITSTPPSQTTSRSRGRGTSRYRNRQIPETSSTAVTIQKSRSQSYYDGTIAPSTYPQYSWQTGRGARPTRPVQGRGGAPLGGVTLALQPGTERIPTLKRTTKGVFDTTLFKSPQSDREMEHRLHMLRQNLPKNHKLY